MKHLIIYSHPNPKSFNHAILEEYSNALKDKKHDARIIDLYSLGFDPVLKPEDFELLQKGTGRKDVLAEKENIKWADVITFIFPIWWTGMPAIIKGYIDRVFTFGFAYAIDETGVKGLLSDKKVMLITTTGTPREAYDGSGMFKSMNQSIDSGIFQFCGMEVIGHKYFAAVPYITAEDRKKMLEEVKNLAK